MNDKPQYHLVSFSGGKDSTAMLLHMMDLGMQIDEVLYCDTYMEFPATIRHIEKIKQIVEDAGIKFVTLKNPQSFKYWLLEHPVKRTKTMREKLGGNPKGYSWAGSRSRWCTSHMKTNLLVKYKAELAEKYDVVEYVGIAFDEQYRLERENNKHQKHPLVVWKWTEANALKYCYSKGYDWEGLYKIFDRVSCWCCPLQPLGMFRRLWENFPDLWEELKEMDKATWRSIKADYSVEELELRFKFEDKRGRQGLITNPRNKGFRTAWKEVLKSFRDGQIDLNNF